MVLDSYKNPYYVLKEVFVYTIKGNTMITFDTEAKEEVRIDVTRYDKRKLYDTIGNRIFVEQIEENGEWRFGGARAYDAITEEMELRAERERQAQQEPQKSEEV